jgi:hypothetical protein
MDFELTDEQKMLQETVTVWWRTLTVSSSANMP